MDVNCIFKATFPAESQLHPSSHPLLKPPAASSADACPADHESIFATEFWPDIEGEEPFQPDPAGLGQHLCKGNPLSPCEQTIIRPSCVSDSIVGCWG